MILVNFQVLFCIMVVMHVVVHCMHLNHYNAELFAHEFFIHLKLELF